MLTINNLLKFDKNSFVLVIALITIANYPSNVSAKSSTNLISKATSNSARDEIAACSNCLSQATSLFAENKSAEAINFLRTWSKKCPNNAQLHLLFATILLKERSNLNEAESEAKLAITANPNLEAAHFQYALISQLLNKTIQAINAYKNLLEINPSSYEAWLSLAELYRTTHQDSEAEIAAQKASFLSPENRISKLRLIKNLKKQKKFAEAKIELKKIIQESEICPEFEQNLADEALEIGDYNLAEIACQNIYKNYPKSIKALITLAFAQYLAKKFVQSEENIEKAFTLDPNNSDAISVQVLNLIAQSKTEDAKKLIDKGNCKTNSALFKFAAAQLAITNKDYQLAFDNLKSIKETEFLGLKVPLILALAETAEKLDLNDEALQYFQDAVKLALSSTEIQKINTSIARIENKMK